MTALVRFSPNNSQISAQEAAFNDSFIKASGHIADLQSRIDKFLYIENLLSIAVFTHGFNGDSASMDLAVIRQIRQILEQKINKIRAHVFLLYMAQNPH